MLIMYLVLCEGHPKAAYPRKIQAEVYASGFSKPCEIVKVSVEGYDCLLTSRAPDGLPDVAKSNDPEK